MLNLKLGLIRYPRKDALPGCAFLENSNLSVRLNDDRIPLSGGLVDFTAQLSPDVVASQRLALDRRDFSCSIPNKVIT